jgi:hypothetical protein
MEAVGDRSAWIPRWAARGRWTLHGARCALLCAVLVAPALAAADESSASGDPAIPPGEEELVAAMLGQGVPLAGCTFTGAALVYTSIQATYDCSGAPVSFELVHPSKAPPSAIQTAEFALTLQSGSPPRSLADALVSRIRAQEAAFEWEWPAAVPADDAEDDGDD